MEKKVCKWCEEERALTEFYSQKKKKADGTGYIYYRPDCKECTNKNAKKWRYNNPEAYDRSQMKWLQSEKGIESNKRRQQRRRDNGNYYKWLKDSGYKYDRSHKEHEISIEEWESCKSYFNYSCAYCGLTEREHQELHNQQLHKEHVNHEGSNRLDNCVPSCKTCNSSKHTFEFEHWYKERSGSYSEERFQKINDWLNNDYKKYIEG